MPSRLYNAEADKEINPFELMQAHSLVPHARRNYLGRVVEAVRSYDRFVGQQLDAVAKKGPNAQEIHPGCKKLLSSWQKRWEKVTKKEGATVKSFNSLIVPKVGLPDARDPLEVMRFLLEEGLPGDFPYVNGVFPLRRESAMETTRQFAGLRLAEHTNERFHFLSQGVASPRLSTAFDGVTLYGADCDEDVGSVAKIGEGGVAVSTLDDMRILYKGFDFRNISTSLTINGPAPIILAMFFNVAIEYMVEQYKKGRSESVDSGEDVDPEYQIPRSALEKIRDETYKIIRGTVQADILKEVQAQNECIFQTDFGIKLMGDVQDFFIRKGIKKFYSISISGYHIGEAGATPIQEIAFTLANGFTYLENFLGRGMSVDDICVNFSFFFRNSHEIEWLAAGPVMRKIWAVAIRDVYRGCSRSQMFKFHTQTSGRALQLQEWDTLNPVRQTLHALIGLLGNTNSLHVDSADEPSNTPSEKYVRQATMIPNVVTFETELLKVQNLLSGSYGMRAIRNAVQDAILSELARIDSEGGVGPAMEVGFQRNRIANASCRYEHDIYEGRRPIIGRNVLPLKDSVPEPPASVVRPTSEDWARQLERTKAFRGRHAATAVQHLDRLKKVARSGGNVFEELLTTVRYCSLGQISVALREVGGHFSQSV